MNPKWEEIWKIIKIFRKKEGQVIEYVQEEVMSSAATYKVAVHSVSYEDHCYSDKLSEAVKHNNNNSMNVL